MSNRGVEYEKKRPEKGAACFYWQVIKGQVNNRT